MRTRDLKPGFFRDLELTELPHVTRLLFAGLWCCADRRGRLQDIPKLIKSDIFPYENVPVEKHLKLLADHAFIKRYEEDGKKCIWIVRFKAHQKPHPNEAESVLPAHPEDPDGGTPTSSSDEHQGDPSRSTKDILEDVPRSSSNRAHTLSSTPSSDLTPSDLSLVPSQPARRSGSVRHALDLTPAEISALRSKFPNADINARWTEWVSWVEEDEGERMPRDKIAAFIGWLKAKKVSAAGGVR